MYEKDPAVWDALQEPVSKNCLHGLITRHKLEHADCANRECGCLCHNPSGGMYAKSWKRDS